MFYIPHDTAYTFFTMAIRNGTKEENPDASFGEIVSNIHTMLRLLLCINVAVLLTMRIYAYHQTAKVNVYEVECTS